MTVAGIDHEVAHAAWVEARHRASATLSDDVPGTAPPDRDEAGWVSLALGVNRGDRVPPEIAAVLQANSPVDDADIAGTTEVETDVLVLGGGGAGCIAALTAVGEAEVLVATKLRVGDGNTVMAEGGMQVALGGDDSLQRHLEDTFAGGHRCADPALVAAMVTDGPATLRWLIELGTTFDTERGDGFARALTRRRAGGTSAARIVSFGDATGLELTRVLREAVRLERRIAVRERWAAVELLTDDDGRCAGAVLADLERRRLVVARAGAVVMATGGAGQLRVAGMPTSNHIGSTADGLALAYRLGAELVHEESFQYHPTGLAWPPRLRGQLVSEAARGAGAHLVNGLGERFVDELSPRDVVTAAIQAECRAGRGIVRDGAVGVFLDTASLAARSPGVVDHELRTLARLGRRNGFDPAAEPVLVAPTLHYQNGGIRIDDRGRTTVPGLFAAGEVAGGIHGRNRLMGNALLDVCVFGRRAGAQAASEARLRRRARVGIEHLRSWRRGLESAGLPLDAVSPLLFTEGEASPRAWFASPLPVSGS